MGGMKESISFTDDESADLQRRAAAARTEVKTFLLHLLPDSDDAGEPSVGDVPYEEWKQAFRSWVARNQSRNFDMDDSRESICE